MAINFDTSSITTGSGTSTTISYPCTGTNRILFVSTASLVQTSTGVTYNGVSMTLIDSYIDSGSVGHAMYYLVNPASGSNNIVVSWSAATINAIVIGASYTGALQVSPIDTSGKVTVAVNTTSYTQSLTTSADNEWGVWLLREASGVAPSNTANTVQRQRDSVQYGEIWADTNSPKSPAGSDTMNLTISPAGNWTSIMAVFKPAIVPNTSSFLPFMN